jgi:sugar O-acyltransferase (sialic acid O-acetyltransferase NeuD family)
MIRKLAIIGAGGFAREVLQIVEDINSTGRTWDFRGFVVVGNYPVPQHIHGHPVHGGSEFFVQHRDVHYVIAVGTSVLRAKLADELADLQLAWATLFHPRAWIGRNVTVGCGSIVCAGAAITTDIRMGEHVHVDVNCAVGHDAMLDAYVTLHPATSIAGKVALGRGVECGAGSRLIPNVTVGAWSVLGAGAVVTESLPANVTAVGVPARVVKTRQVGWHEAP